MTEESPLQRLVDLLTKTATEGPKRLAAEHHMALELREYAVRVLEYHEARLEDHEARLRRLEGSDE